MEERKEGYFNVHDNVNVNVQCPSMTTIILNRYSTPISKPILYYKQTYKSTHTKVSRSINQ